MGIIQTVTQAVSDGASALQITWEAAQVLPDLVTEFNNLKAAKNAADSAGSIEAGSKMIQDAEPLIKKCADILHSTSISNSSKGNPPQNQSTKGVEFSRNKKGDSINDNIKLLFIQPGKPKQNAYIERYNRTVRYDWLNQHTRSARSCH